LPELTEIEMATEEDGTKTVSRALIQLGEDSKRLAKAARELLRAEDEFYALTGKPNSHAQRVMAAQRISIAKGLLRAALEPFPEGL
jgi:hypothetical protein